MSMTRRKKLLWIGCGGVPVAYVLLYLLNAAFGGYDPHWTSDGRWRYESGLLMHDCIMWQPRFGSYYNEYRHDLLGLAFYPLLQLDQRYIHKTHSLEEDDSFVKWVNSLTDADIHPLYRADYRRAKAIETKYRPQLEAARTRGDKAEAKRIRSLIREEESGAVTNK
jgi:hypothetical protein